MVPGPAVRIAVVQNSEPWVIPRFIVELSVDFAINSSCVFSESKLRRILNNPIVDSIPTNTVKLSCRTMAVETGLYFSIDVCFDFFGIRSTDFSERFHVSPASRYPRSLSTEFL